MNSQEQRRHVRITSRDCVIMDFPCPSLEGLFKPITEFGPCSLFDSDNLTAGACLFILSYL